MKFSRQNNLLILHLTVLVWGFTGILGALISINEIQLVWYRVLIGSTTLFVYLKWAKIDLNIDKITFIKLFFTGAIVGLHWILFFGAIKASTVSVTMVCLSSLTLFTAVLEPLLSKNKISTLDILVGLCIIFGIYLIFKFETQYQKGIIMGLSSALCASLFSIINSKQVQNRSAVIIGFYELLGAFFWVSIYLIFTGGFNVNMRLNQLDFIYLMILGTICTSLAYVAGVSVMKELSAFRVALITNLEPIYAIILAIIIFGDTEKMTLGFYSGAIIILGSIFLYPVVKNRISIKNFKN